MEESAWGPSRGGSSPWLWGALGKGRGARTPPDPEGLRQGEGAEFIPTRVRGCRADPPFARTSLLVASVSNYAIQVLFLCLGSFQSFSHVLLTPRPVPLASPTLDTGGSDVGVDAGLGVSRGGGVLARAPCLPQPQQKPRSSHAGRRRAPRVSTSLQLVWPCWGHREHGEPAGP